MIKTTISDEPRNGINEEDQFGLSAYEKGLEAFLRGAETPVTIALQGEWGSGRTSLMNVLHDNLCGEDDKYGEYFSVWINTWEYTLMRDSSDALKQILLRMSKEIVSYGKSALREIDSKIMKSIMGLGVVLTKTLGNSYLNGAVDEVQEYIRSSQDNAIADLRNYIQAGIDECLRKNEEKKGFVFFIDDMDRIDPTVAVELLVLLKNIFTLKNCILVLAIDYDVVVKGLKPKLGELNDTNEREFRSFYDKIIQVPFSMPVSQYSTKDFLIKELKRIGIISSLDEKNEHLMNNIVKVENLTTGPNPRSIKKLLNTLSLIQCIKNARESVKKNHVTDADEQDKALNTLLTIAIVGIQVAYPKVYQLLCDEFDEDWEKTLQQVCQSDRYLKKNASNISQLFNLLRSEILSSSPLVKDNADTDKDKQVARDIAVRKCIQDQLSQSFITGLNVSDM